MPRWTTDDIPDQTGRIAVITGANSGIGYHTAEELARKGATVVLACRSQARGEEAVERLHRALPRANAALMLLDLGNLDSVHAFVETFAAHHDRLDLLINNAGVMFPPLGRTAQGFELQLGINHLGHFALTGLLLPWVRKAEQARIVVVASTAHRAGSISLDDPNWASRRFNTIAAYGQSKLANLLFARELTRRLPAHGVDAIAVSAHPGWTSTNLGRESTIVSLASRLLAQSALMGALPTLRAATDPEAAPDVYYGPRGPGELRGYPVEVGRNEAAKDDTVASELWALSEQLTGVRFLPA